MVTGALYYYQVMMNKPTFIAGPCVIESPELLSTIAEELVRLNKKYDIDIIFKASFDKANRTSIHSFRGPGLDKGLAMLQAIKDKYGLRLLTDIHESYQAEAVGGSYWMSSRFLLSLSSDRLISGCCKDWQDCKHQESTVP